MLNIDFDQLRHNLLLTQTYCEQQLVKTHENPASILRSINPVYNKKNIFEFGQYHYGTDNQYCHTTKWTTDPYYGGSGDLIEELYYVQIVEKKQLNLASTNGLLKGDIFVFSLDETLIDGAAEVESAGYLDGYNCPPIDTWFYLIGSRHRRLLLSWVPKQFLEAVDVGILVNPEGCIDWFSNWYPAEYDQIKSQLIV